MFRLHVSSTVSLSFYFPLYLHHVLTMSCMSSYVDVVIARHSDIELYLLSATLFAYENVNRMRCLATYCVLCTYIIAWVCLYSHPHTVEANEMPWTGMWMAPMTRTLCMKCKYRHRTKRHEWTNNKSFSLLKLLLRCEHNNHFLCVRFFFFSLWSTVLAWCSRRWTEQNRKTFQLIT